MTRNDAKGGYASKQIDTMAMFDHMPAHALAPWGMQPNTSPSRLLLYLCIAGA